MADKRIVVFGAGAVGGYLGARLAQAGHNVTLVTRPAVAEIFNGHGLEIHDGELTERTRPTAVASLRQALLRQTSYDAVLLAMKSYDLEGALNELIAFYPDPPLLITLQNGVGLEEPLIEQFGAARVIAGSLTIPLSLDTNHSIRVERGGRGLALAPTERRQDIGQWVALFNEAGVQTVGLGNYQAMKWSKLLLNSVGNATSAILNRHPRVIYGYEPTFRLEMAMLREALAVMRKLKLRPVNLPGSPARRLAFAVGRLPLSLAKLILTEAVAGGRGNKMPSFHGDLTAGKPKNEVLYHNGAVARYGQATGVATPVNLALTDILLKLARKEIGWEVFNGKPDRLVDEVRKYDQAQPADALRGP